MRENAISREKLNKAIFTVLKTQFKKDAPESFKIVEQAGFKIEKWNGTFAVVSDNGKYAKLEWNTRSDTYQIYLRFSYNRNHKWFSYWKPCPIDFVGYFESPIKKREDPYGRHIGWGEFIECSDAVYTYYTKIRNTTKAIESTRKDIENKKKHIASLQRQISECMNDIERYYKDIAEYEKKLDANRRELGLKKAN